MRKTVVFSLLALFPSLLTAQNVDNTQYVKQYLRPNWTVGQAVTAAQAACNPDAAVPCVIVFDPSLAKWTAGTMPAQCTQCQWLDYRTGAPYLPSGGGKVSGGLYTASGPFACAEYYLAPAMSGDYGQAINAAVQAQSLTARSTVKLCAPGDHNVATEIVVDRPVTLDGTGTTLDPTSALESAPVSTTATITLGTKTITVANATGLLAGQAIGGTGLPAAETIAASYSGGTSVPLSLAPVLTFSAIATSGSNQVCGISDMVGLATGEGVTVASGSSVTVPGGTTITALTPGGTTSTSGQCITLSANLTGTTPTVRDYNSQVQTQRSVFALSGTLSVPVTAVSTTPVIRFEYNASALHNSEGQMIGGGLTGVHIADIGNRSLTGVQGAQFYSWDRLVISDLEVDNLDGSCLILGGYNTPNNGGKYVVRESQFSMVQCRDSGDLSTGQSTLEIMDPTTLGDRTNQIDFPGFQAVFPYAEGVTIGSYYATPTQPAYIRFVNDAQIEGGSHTAWNIPVPADLVGIQSGYDIHFNSANVQNPAYGHSAVRVDNGYLVNVLDGRLGGGTPATTYTVTFASGTTFNGTGFPPASVVNGMGAILTDAVCATGCPVWLTAANSVNGAGTTMTLAALPSGDSSPSGSITIALQSVGLYMTDTSNAWQKSEVMGANYSDASASQLPLYGLVSTAQQFFSGILPPQSYVFDSPSLGNLAIGGSSGLNGVNIFPSINTGGIYSTGNVQAANFQGNFESYAANTAQNQLFQNHGSGTSSQQFVTAATDSGTDAGYIAASANGSWFTGMLGDTTSWSVIDQVSGHAIITVQKGAPANSLRVDVNGNALAKAGLQPGATQVSNLPSAGSYPGLMLQVTDSTAVTTEGQTCIGGSTNGALAVSTGSGWKCF